MICADNEVCVCLFCCSLTIELMDVISVSMLRQQESWKTELISIAEKTKDNVFCHYTCHSYYRPLMWLCSKNRDTELKQFRSPRWAVTSYYHINFRQHYLGAERRRNFFTSLRCMLSHGKYLSRTITAVLVHNIQACIMYHLPYCC